MKVTGLDCTCGQGAIYQNISGFPHRMCVKCQRWEPEPEPKFGRHTYRELYSERRCEICGREKSDLIHAGAVPVET